MHNEKGYMIRQCTQRMALDYYIVFDLVPRVWGPENNAEEEDFSIRMFLVCYWSQMHNIWWLSDNCDEKKLCIDFSHNSLDLKVVNLIYYWKHFASTQLGCKHRVVFF